MAYLALIGDIKQSRLLPNRVVVQERLEWVCDHLNADAESLGLVSPLTVTLGDEFQALFRSARALWQVVFAVESALQGDDDSEPEVAMRFGVGIGNLSTPLNSTAAIGMDGPAFHRAREAIETLKRDDRRYRVEGLQQEAGLARHMLDYISNQRTGWRRNRVRVFSRLLAGETPAATAAVIGISDRAVYKNIRHGDLETLASVLTELASVIDATIEGSP
jgi:hypothetical protein